MGSFCQPFPHRTFLRGSALGATAWYVPGVFTEQVARTPRQTQGPFYPDHLSLVTDNDPLISNDALVPVVGEVTHVSGRVLTSAGDPIRGAVVEICQVDSNGVYLRSHGPGHERRDVHFQGFGRLETSSTGEYRFRTIQPVPYARGSFRRSPHIHFAVHVKDREKFTTQCYIKGHPLNARDPILNGIRDARQRAPLVVDFVPIKDPRTGERVARFDMVLGVALQDLVGRL